MQRLALVLQQATTLAVMMEYASESPSLRTATVTRTCEFFGDCCDDYYDICGCKTFNRLPVIEYIPACYVV